MVLKSSGVVAEENLVELTDGAGSKRIYIQSSDRFVRPEAAGVSVLLMVWWGGDENRKLDRGCHGV